MTSAQIIYSSLGIIVLLALILLRFIYKKSFMLQTPEPKKPLPCQPDDFHLAYQNVMFNAADGTILKGWFIPSLDEYSSETLILCHGRGSNKGELLQRTHFLADKYNLLYFDFRGSGESGGNMSTIGYLETRDFDAAYQFLKKNREGYADEIAVFGSSVGASVAIYGAAKYQKIKGIALDSPFLSLRSVISNWCKYHSRILLPFVSLALVFSRRSLKTDPETYSPKFNAGKINCPVLFIFGENDRLIPSEDRNALVELCGSSCKEVFVVNGATHTKCAETGGVMYREKIAAFFQNVFAGEKRNAVRPENGNLPVSGNAQVNQNVPEKTVQPQKSKKKNKKNKK
ncbi:MAG: alpha/beta hydrolase [Elusimicrobiales bacterium]|nr:alpha/beta hydrolase [Elusimicrobiales bacterium]